MERHAGNRLGICDVCSSKDAKYTCPRCGVNSCSLGCSQQHKKELECDGLRQRSSYIPLNSFNADNLHEDILFFDEVTRCKDGCFRDKIRNNSRFLQDLPPHLSRLRYAAAQRKIRLLFLPQHFTAHKENTTFLNWQNRKLHWRIKFVFPADGKSFDEAKALEQLSLDRILPKYVDNTSTDFNAKLIQEQIPSYASLGLDGIAVLMKMEKYPGKTPKYHKLDISASIKNNLENKLVIEHPVFTVIPTSDLEKYEIAKPEEENRWQRGREMQQAAREQNSRIEPPHHNHDVGNNENNGDDDDDDDGPPEEIPTSRSLLFGTDFSDSDTEETPPTKQRRPNSETNNVIQQHTNSLESNVPTSSCFKSGPLAFNLN